MTEELKIITNQPTEVKLSNGETILIYSFRFRDFAKVIQILANYANILGQLESADGMTLMRLLTEDNGDGMIEAMKISCRNQQKEEFWDELELDDAATILASVVERNISFFRERVSPQFERLTKTLSTLRSEPEGDTSEPEAKSSQSQDLPALASAK